MELLFKVFYNHRLTVKSHKITIIILGTKVVKQL